MQATNTQTLVHVGTELVVIGGVTFWLNKKISSLEERVKELETKNAEYEKILSNHGQILARHNELLMRITGMGHVHNEGNENNKRNVDLDSVLQEEIDEIEKDRHNSEESSEVHYASKKKSKKRKKVLG